MADGFLDKVLDIITKSEKIGFAAAFAGATFFLGRHYGFKPFVEVEQPMVGYILYGTLIGTGLLVARALIWVGELFGSMKVGIGNWSQRRLAPQRLNELMHDELLAVLWMLQHKTARVGANRYIDPFVGLVRKGFLEPSDGSEREQVLFINTTVYGLRDLILEQYKHFEPSKVSAERPPWERDPDRWV